MSQEEIKEYIEITAKRHPNFTAADFRKEFEDMMGRKASLSEVTLFLKFQTGTSTPSTVETNAGQKYDILDISEDDIFSELEKPGVHHSSDCVSGAFRPTDSSDVCKFPNPQTCQFLAKKDCDKSETKATAIFGTAMRKGIFRWEVKVTLGGSNPTLIVGVTPEELHSEDCLGKQGSGSCGLLISDDKTGVAGVLKTFISSGFRAMKPDTTIAVELNFQNRTVTFFINGEKFSTMAQGIADKEYYFAVSFKLPKCFHSPRNTPSSVSSVSVQQPFSPTSFEYNPFDFKSAIIPWEENYCKWRPISSSADYEGEESDFY